MIIFVQHVYHELFGNRHTLTSAFKRLALEARNHYYTGL